MKLCGTGIRNKYANSVNIIFKNHTIPQKDGVHRD